MRTSELFQQRKVLSFEIFPPKRDGSVDSIYHTMEQLRDLNPDFISVTYGAGGSGFGDSTLRIADAVKNRYGLETVAHLPSIHLSKAEVRQLLGDLKAAGIENILALRGDVNPNIPPCHDFRYASDLIAFIKEEGNFNILAACYPEVHRESPSVVEDMRHLKEKVDAGASHLISQLFLDNRHFYTFMERAELAGIHVPVEAGIMPVVNKKQIERMVQLCGVELPRKFVSIINRYEHNPVALRDAGIAYAVDQIVDLIAQGVHGIHLYTMNNAYIARRIHEAIHSQLAA